MATTGCVAASLRMRGLIARSCGGSSAEDSRPLLRRRCRCRRRRRCDFAGAQRRTMAEELPYSFYVCECSNASRTDEQDSSKCFPSSPASSILAFNDVGLGASYFCLPPASRGNWTTVERAWAGFFGRRALGWRGWRLFQQDCLRVSERPFGLRDHDVLLQSTHRRVNVASEGINPVRPGKVVLKFMGQLHVFNAERKHPNAETDCALHLNRHMRRGVCLGREDQHHGTGGLNGANDLGRVGRSRDHVSWRNPARCAALLKRTAHAFGNLTLCGCVADEHVPRHLRPRSGCLVAGFDAFEIRRLRRLRRGITPVNDGGSNKGQVRAYLALHRGYMAR